MIEKEKFILQIVDEIWFYINSSSDNKEHLNSTILDAYLE